MSRFLLTCWSYTGHLFHGINIGRALRERGHEVAFYSAPKTAQMFADEGFTFFPFEKLDEEAMSDILFAPNRERSVKDMLQFTRTLQSYLLDTIPQQVEDLEPILASWKPDVLVDDGTILGPILVLWEKYNIPHSMVSPAITVMVMARCTCNGGALESATATVKRYSPAVAGTPEIAPECACSLRPGGSCPSTRRHE